MLSVLIVDDEPLAHTVLIHHLHAQKDFQLIGQCYSAIEALQWLANNKVDVVFLDINMPQLNGIDMLKVMGEKPQIVIVSAYQEYAIDGFELDVCDYLLKPVSKERFEQALIKLKRSNTALEQDLSTKAQLTIILKVDREMQKFSLSEIIYLEAYGNYVKVWQEHGCVLVSSTLKQIALKLPSSLFTKVYKSHIVNHQFVKSVGIETVTLATGKQLRIGKTFKGKIGNILKIEPT